ncbi:MAG: hypothetical protein GX416_07120 [Bacteroidales bacterium]|nr:hypothetical protein [Bacteroidales bacterium]
MKKLFNILIMCYALLFFVCGCYDDKGNYNYMSENELMPVGISAIDSISVKTQSALNITPKLTNDDTSRYTYLWYTLDKSNPYTRDTLSTQHDLSINCNLSVGNYTLYYQVKDPRKNIYKSVNTPLTVTATDINAGWYVLKAKDGFTDVDYFSLSGAMKANLLTDVVKTEKLQGTPVSMIYIPSNYNHAVTNPDGTTTILYNQSAYHIVANKDMVTLNANDLTVFKRLNDEFYETPSNINLQGIQQDSYNTQYLINDGHLHFQYGGQGIGKFNYQLAGGQKVYPTLICGSYDVYSYDQNSHCIYDTKFGDGFTLCSDENGSTTCFSDSAFVMLNFLPRVDEIYSVKCYGVLKNGLNDKYYIADFGISGQSYMPTPTFSEIPATSGLVSSTVMAAPRGASVIYYATDNKLMMYKVAFSTDEVLKAFDIGEQVSFIKNMRGTNLDETTFNDLVVITNSSGGYKVYRFPLVGSAGEINATSSAVMTGTGAANFIMFRQN